MGRPRSGVTNPTLTYAKHLIQACRNTPRGSAAATAGRNAAAWSAYTRCAYRSMALRPVSKLGPLAPPSVMSVHLALRADASLLYLLQRVLPSSPVVSLRWT